MYREMFLEFSDSILYRQEVVGALITHCGAGSDMETDSALSALSALASPTYVRQPPSPQQFRFLRFVCNTAVWYCFSPALVLPRC